MAIPTHFEQLLAAAAAQPEPQRLLFVFATAGLPDDASPPNASVSSSAWGCAGPAGLRRQGAARAQHFPGAGRRIAASHPALASGFRRRAGRPRRPSAFIRNRGRRAPGDGGTRVRWRSQGLACPRPTRRAAAVLLNRAQRIRESVSMATASVRPHRATAPVGRGATSRLGNTVQRARTSAPAHSPGLPLSASPVIGASGGAASIACGLRPHCTRGESAASSATPSTWNCPARTCRL